MTRTAKVWAGIAVVAVIVLTGLSLLGNGKSAGAQRAARAAEENTRIAQQNTDRTECIRAISNELDHARWNLIWRAFNATDRSAIAVIGAEGSSLPQPIDVADTGGDILRVHFDRCPPAPVTTPTEGNR